MERLKLGNKLWCVSSVAGLLVLLLLVGAVVLGCSQEAGNKLVQDEALKKEYEAVYTAAASEDEVAVALVGFEAAHPQHFQSKVDLAQRYFAEGEYVLSYQYLQRALALMAESDTETISFGVEADSMELMYRLLSYLCLFRGDVVQAEDFSRKALSYAEQGAKAENQDAYRAPALYLLGLVLSTSAEGEALSQSERLQEALTSFDEAYALSPTMISSSHLLAYGKLLVQAQRGAEAEKVLEDYFVLGNLNLDTLSIGKTMYSTTGNQMKAKICEFLAYEYLVGGISVEAAVAEGLEIESFGEKNWLSEYEALVESRDEAEKMADSGEFFGKSFCEVAFKMAKGHGTKGDITTLLELEGYFVNFPSYYWLLWQLATEVLDQQQLQRFIPALKKVISLNQQGIYAQQARTAIMKLLENQDLSANVVADAVLDKVLF